MESVRSWFAGILCAAGLALPAAAIAQDCTAVKDDSARLLCYDRAYRLAPEAQSIWDARLIADARRETFSLTSYRPSYVLVTRMGSTPTAEARPRDPGATLDPDEVKFQLSLQTKVADDLLAGNGDLWLAYTQVAFWQAYNRAMSTPFRETNHRPEGYVSFLTDYRLLGARARTVNFGVVHESNGRVEPASRSWNRVFAELFVVRGNAQFSLRPWVRVGNIEDNPDIEDYLGRYELRALYERNGHIYAAMLRNLFRAENRYNAELNWSFPIAGRLRGLVQFYSGYGENLIDYNFKARRLGLGVLISDWL